MNELKIYLDMSDEKLVKLHKIYQLNVSLSLVTLVLFFGLSIFLHFISPTTVPIMVLVLLFIFIVSIYCKQTLRYIEIVQKFKKMKSIEIGTPLSERPSHTTTHTDP